MRKASLLELCHDEKKYETFSISENNESLLSDCRAKKMYVIVNKQVKFLTAFPSSQMSRAKLALAMSWRGNVSNSIYRHL